MTLRPFFLSGPVRRTVAADSGFDSHLNVRTFERSNV